MSNIPEAFPEGMQACGCWPEFTDARLSQNSGRRGRQKQEPWGFSMFRTASRPSPESLHDGSMIAAAGDMVVIEAGALVSLLAPHRFFREFRRRKPGCSPSDARFSNRTPRAAAMI